MVADYHHWNIHQILELSLSPHFDANIQTLPKTYNHKILNCILNEKVDPHFCGIESTKSIRSSTEILRESN
jgi:hypothetical protein